MNRKIVSFDKAMSLYTEGYRDNHGPWFYVTSDMLLQKYDRGACTEIYRRGDRFYNEVDSMVIEGDYIPAPTQNESRKFHIKKTIEKWLKNEKIH